MNQRAPRVPLLQRLCPCTGVPYYQLLRLFVAVSVLAFLCYFPVHLVAEDPDQWNPLAQVLFQLITAVISIAIGYQISRYTSEREATGKWLPAAQSACNQLLTMRAQVYRLRLLGKTTCDEIQGLLEQTDKQNRVPIEKLVRTKCDSCKSRLLDLENHISTAYKAWELFIDHNCDRREECDRIRDALTQWLGELEQQSSQPEETA